MNVTIETFEEAIAFAVQAHKGQTRKGDGRPYILHPMSVMLRIYKAKRSENMFLLGTVAILHDTVEDCNVTLQQITEKFGLYVAAIVEELTLDNKQYKLIGKAKYLTQRMLKMSSYALSIKLCDRLDNVSDLDTMNSVFRDNYIAETIYILNDLHLRKLTNTHLKLIDLIVGEIVKYRSYSWYK